MLLHRALDLFQPSFIEDYILDFDAGFEPDTCQESDDIFYLMCMGGEL